MGSGQLSMYCIVLYKVSISGNVLCISVHYKPTDSHSYLLYSSSHPSHVKISLSLLSQLSRGQFAANRFERERLLRRLHASSHDFGSERWLISGKSVLQTRIMNVYFSFADYSTMEMVF